MNLENKIEKLFYELVATRSDTGTALEKDIEKFIHKELSEYSYYKENPSHFGTFDLEDHLNRQVIWGLLKGNGNDTIVLLHHHDAVDTFDFGKYEAYALQPKKLKAIYQTLNFNKEITEDLDNENWCFGRGTSDMKAGAAIQMAILEHYSQLDNFEGNLLLLSVPDEETYSSGMRSSIELLNQLKEKYQLDYRLLINSEPHERRDESVGTYYDGSVGKLMPVVYVKGRKSHIGQIFSGFNPLSVLARIAIKTETNMSFSDQIGENISPPPSWSYLKDFKKSYDASIPEAAGGYFSVLTLTQTPKDILEKLKVISLKAFEEAVHQVNKEYDAFKTSDSIINIKPRVMYFSEIYALAVKKHGEIFENIYSDTINEIREEISKGDTIIPNSNFKLIKKTLEYIDDPEPIVVLSISPPYYPHVSNDFLETDYRINQIHEVINQSAGHFNESYELQKYFMGISDLSYTSLNNSEAVVPYIKNNMPLWDHLYSINFEGLKKLNIPVMNIGPWGKDLHKLTERVNLMDLKYHTPKLIMDIIENVINKN
ncbi:MAG TPA: M20/M25/M40 family metallo-hydrolase [Clostridia bacterium]|nr:M20/M25/M40 family metallo-hydrolase [Clostridia bacterium]